MRGRRLGPCSILHGLLYKHRSHLPTECLRLQQHFQILQAFRFLSYAVPVPVPYLIQLRFRLYFLNKCRGPEPLVLGLKNLNSVVCARDRHLSANVVPSFADRGCHVVSVTDFYGRVLGFLDRSRYYFFQVVLQLYS
jgi:hypothetical protein